MIFNRILIPLDGSPAAEAVLSQAERLLRRADSEILLLRVAPLPVYPYTEFPIALPGHLEEARAYVDGLAGRLSGQGARARGIALEGGAAPTILDVAEKEKVSLIAMSTHGRSGLSRWVFGNVTEKVLRHSPIPVLVFRSFKAGSTPTKAAPLTLKKILVPVERFRLDIIPVVREVAQLFGAGVELLHVVEPGENTAARKEAQTQVGAVGRTLQDAGIPSVLLEREGLDPAHEILRASQDEHADLIAITTHGRSGPARWALGSVTEKVLKSATIPLLVVRKPA